MDRTLEEDAADFNREEYLRPIPPGDPDHQRLYGIRDDAESGNANLDNAMLRERAHSVGRQAIKLNMLTWAMYKNAQARALHRERSLRPAA